MVYWSHGRSSGWLPLHGPHLFKIALAPGASSKFSERMATLSAFAARPERVARAWNVLRFLGANDDPLGQCFRPVFSAGAKSVLEILRANDDPFVVCGTWQHWRMERPRSSGRERRPLSCFRCVAALARGASSKF